MVEVPKWLEIPVKSMLRDLAIDFREQSEQWSDDWVRLEVTGVEAQVAQSGCGLSYWCRFFKGFPHPPHILLVASAYWHSFAYTKALDRWKGKQDKMSNQLKTTPIVRYLDKHLKKVILQAKTSSQLSEAVGLNLAKIEMVKENQEVTPKPMVAIGGIRASLDSLDLQELVAQGLGEQAGYYLCYDYSSAMSEDRLFTGFFNYLNGQKHHYVYDGAYCFDLRSGNYQMMVVLYQEGLHFNRGILGGVQGKRAIVFYELSMVEQEPEAFVAWIKEMVAAKI